MENEQKIIRYTLWMLENHTSASLYDRLKTLGDILAAVPSYHWPEIIEAVCKIQEDEDNADV